MKKSPSPLIIRPGHIRKLNHNSNDGVIGNSTHQSNPKYYSRLNYIKSAAQKVRGVFSALLFWKKRENSSENQTDSNNRRDQIEGTSSSPGRQRRNSSRRSNAMVETGHIRIHLSFDVIYKATGNFSQANKIGEGGFGTVYKGTLENGFTVAVKRARKDKNDPSLSTEFKNEIVTLSHIEHLSLVRFYGYVEHKDERIIIVEYVNNGTLRQHLDGQRGNGLEIAQRLDIATDIAHAITYLHTYSDPPIIHRDIKASNILITDQLRGKVTDFGFARSSVEDPGATHISTQVKGTAGYLDPEYLRTYQLTEKSDVYSFGVLLVEMMTGRHPIESKRSLDERVSIRWALRKLKDGEADLAMDPRLRRSVASIQAVEKVLELARHCLAPSRQSRPSMRKCAEVLWGIRKELREANLSPVDSSSFHSGNLIERQERKNRQNLFGIEVSDSLMFVSV